MPRDAAQEWARQSDDARTSRMLRDDRLTAFGRNRAGEFAPASPMAGEGRRQVGAPPNVILPVGQCITVTADTTIPDGGGFVEFDTIVQALTAGFNPTMPTSELKSPWTAVSGVPLLHVRWKNVDHDSAWKGHGSWAELLLAGAALTPRWSAGESALPYSTLTASMPHIPVQKGDGLRLWLHQESGSGQDVHARLSFGMQDPTVIQRDIDPGVLPAYPAGKGESETSTVQIVAQDVEVGDTLCAVVHCRKTSDVNTPPTGPAGWTVIQNTNNPSASSSRTYWEKVADSGDVGATWEWATNGASNAISAVVYGVRGPVSVHQRESSAQSSVTTRNYQSYTPPAAAAVIVNLFSHGFPIVSIDGDEVQLTSPSSRPAAGSLQFQAAGGADPGGSITQDGSSVLQHVRWIYVAS